MYIASGMLVTEKEREFTHPRKIKFKNAIKYYFDTQKIDCMQYGTRDAVHKSTCDVN